MRMSRFYVRGFKHVRRFGLLKSLPSAVERVVGEEVTFSVGFKIPRRRRDTSEGGEVTEMQRRGASAGWGWCSGAGAWNILAWGT
jgi:hypothetical protein